MRKGYGTGKVGVSHFTRGVAPLGPLLQNSVSAPAHILLACFHFFKVKAEGSDQVGHITVQKPNCAMQIILTHVELALMPSDFVAGPTH